MSILLSFSVTCFHFFMEFDHPGLRELSRRLIQEFLVPKPIRSEYIFSKLKGVAPFSRLPHCCCFYCLEADLANLTLVPINRLQIPHIPIFFGEKETKIVTAGKCFDYSLTGINKEHQFKASGQTLNCLMQWKRSVVCPCFICLFKVSNLILSLYFSLPFDPKNLSSVV